ncbi:AIM24 family protein [Sporosarcina jeotgali]|uniref:AIM24 family protein n=2 Tax=Sporosarcina jeotgali TaxID=3020056 RepID=A0ABZ0KTC1_9BACL|nr:AIM24 family protein [Sporosarcina sp. B2O-1]
MAGDVRATTGIKGVGDFIGKTIRGKMTKESGIKPEYTGTGTLVLEPTFKHILLLDIDEWNQSLVIEDGLFLACDSGLKHKAVMRTNLSSAALGGGRSFQSWTDRTRNDCTGIFRIERGTYRNRVRK